MWWCYDYGCVCVRKNRVGADRENFGIHGRSVNECLCVCPGVVKFDSIIHVEAVTLLPKPTNETSSCQRTHTGHGDQLLNENDQVSNAALTAAPLQIPAVLHEAIKQSVPQLSSSGWANRATAAVFIPIKTPNG